MDEEYPTRMQSDVESGGIRLQKVLAGAGLGSRRACEELIAAGRVEVDGRRVTEQGMRVDPEQVQIRVDGTRVSARSDTVYLVLNKPLGVVSTMSDPEGRPCIGDYLVDRNQRLFHVGRLDTDTDGLILLTNDGDLANRLTHPRYEVPKSYRVRVWGAPVSPRAVEALRAGVELDDGLTAPARVRKLAWDTIELTIREGRNRQVKRMCEHVGHRVRSLQRVAFGPLLLADLPEGGHRVLTAAEVQALSGDP